MNTIGGVRRDIPADMIPKIEKSLDFLEERAKYYANAIQTEQTVLKRTVDVGVLATKDAVDLCAVGPTLRASGVKNDVRADDPYAAYGDVPFDVITHDTGDVFSRLLVRAKELLECVKISRYALEHMPAGMIRAKTPMAVPTGEVVSRVEAPRGELIHYIKSNGTTKPERYKVRSPTLGNIPALCKTLMGSHLADVPIILAGIDPCFSCMDRMVFTDVKSNNNWVWTMQELKRHASK
jgi:NADH-quinone oxidoreductase subunit D